MEKVTLSNYGYKVAQIEINANCNMACSFCPYPIKEDKTTKLPTQDIINTIDQIDANDEKLDHICFSQINEPLLDNRFFEIAEYAKKSGFKIRLVTNGILLNKEKNVNGIFNLKPDLYISLQVLDKNIHKTARGLNLDLDIYVQTITDFCKKAKNKDFNVQVVVGCNFNTKFSHFLKKILGVSTGDPSVPRDIKTTFSRLRAILEKFYEISDDEYKENLKSLKDVKEMKKIFIKDYWDQEGFGFKIFKNVSILVRCFWYGKKLSEFKPINNNFSCNTRNLGVLADGSVQPCCITYNNDLSLGNIKDSSLKSILEGNKFLYNLRKKGGEKHLTCRKCFGEPTYRGTFVKKLYFALPLKIRNSKFVTFFTQSY